MGWLHAVPRPLSPPLGEPDTRSRLQRITDDGGKPEFPDVAALHVIGYLMEVGPAAVGPAVLSHSEIRAWQENTGIELSAWEACALRTLSRDYLAELHAAERLERPAPYSASTAQLQRVAKSMRAAIAAMAKN